MNVVNRSYSGLQCPTVPKSMTLRAALFEAFFCKTEHRVTLMQRGCFRHLAPRHAGAHARRLKNDTV